MLVNEDMRRRVAVRAAPHLHENRTLFCIHIAIYSTIHSSSRSHPRIHAPTVMLRLLVLIQLVTSCLCEGWQDSYLDAYQESEGTVFAGPYPPSPGRTPMQMRPNMTTTPAAMMPLIFQIVMLAARIMLKFTIFKMIVKWIAVLCLFLFIPTLRLPRAMKRSEDKAWKNTWADLEGNTVESLTIFVKDSLKKYKDLLD